MNLVWKLLETSLGEESPLRIRLSERGVRALVVSVRDPDQPARWRAAEHGEQRSSGAGFHAEYEEMPDGDEITVWFDGRLREEPVRIAWAVLG